MAVFCWGNNTEGELGIGSALEDEQVTWKIID